MINVLQYNPTADFVLATTAEDIAGVTNQTVNFPSSGTYCFSLNLAGLCQKDPLLHRWTFSLLIDNSTSIDFPTFPLFNSDITDKNNVVVSLETTVAAGNHDIRIQWRKTEGVSQLDVDEKTYIGLVIAGDGGGGGGQTEFADNVFRVIDNADNTKKIAFEASTVSTGTVKTITMPDANIDLADVNAHKVSRLGTAASVQTSGQTLIGVTDTTAPRTITLATADAVLGKLVYIKDESGGATTNNITVDTQGAETIDGVASVAISVDYGALRLYSDGSNWFTL
jgi:hypothetical protein